MNFDNNIVQNNLLTVVGFDPSYDPSFAPLPIQLSTSESGLKFNDGSIQYINLENLKDFAVNFSNYIYSEYSKDITYIAGTKIKYTHPEWTKLKTYQICERVFLNGQSYESLQNSNSNKRPDINGDFWISLFENYSIYDAIPNANINVNNQPDISILFWNEINLFYDFLIDRVKASISNIVSKCVQSQNTILEQKRLYYGIGDGSIVILNDVTMICGLKFDFIRQENVKMKVNRIGLQFNSPITDLDIYLFNQNTQIATFKVSTISDDFIWVDVSNIELTTDKVGSWFLYYKMNDIELQNSNSVNNDIYITKNISNFVRINCFCAPEILNKKLINTNHYTYTTSYFANLDFSIVPDLTKWISYNKLIFAESIRFQFAMDMYNLFLSNDNTRANRTQRSIPIDDLKVHIFTANAETLKKSYDTELNNLRTSIGKAKIDCINLPSANELYTFSTII